MTKTKNVILTIPKLAQFRKSGIFSGEFYPKDEKSWLNMYLFCNSSDIFNDKPFRLNSEKNRFREAKSIYNSKKFKSAIECSRYVCFDNILKDMKIKMNKNNLPYHLTQKYHRVRYLENTFFENSIPIVHSHLENIIKNSSILTKEKGEECLEQLSSSVFLRMDEFLISKGLILDAKLDVSERKFFY
jgi:hypothetical protein